MGVAWRATGPGRGGGRGGRRRRLGTWRWVAGPALARPSGRVARVVDPGRPHLRRLRDPACPGGRSRWLPAGTRHPGHAGHRRWCGLLLLLPRILPQRVDVVGPAGSQHPRAAPPGVGIGQPGNGGSGGRVRHGGGRGGRYGWRWAGPGRGRWVGGRWVGRQWVGRRQVSRRRGVATCSQDGPAKPPAHPAPGSPRAWCRGPRTGGAGARWQQSVPSQRQRHFPSGGGAGEPRSCSRRRESRPGRGDGRPSHHHGSGSDPGASQPGGRQPGAGYVDREPGRQLVEHRRLVTVGGVGLYP